MRNNIIFLFPTAIFLNSQSNEEDTNTSIEDLGHNLANEVIAFIEQQFETIDNVNRISFVGHSLGGLIIRSSLMYLEVLKPKLFTYMTLSSPHLGYTQGGSKLVSTGIWFLKKWKKSTCLKQLAMQDHPDLRQTVVY